jgi:Family of unknown function (DUF5764)
MEAIVEARREYMNMLQECMIPEMTNTYIEMYNDTDEMLIGERGRIHKFREACSRIQDWGDNTIDDHVDRIKEDCPWFERLIEASVISLVQILKSVKINKNASRLAVTIPTAAEFVRKCYKTSQAYICKSPDFIVDEDRREEVLFNKITKSIDTVVRSYVPLHNIMTLNLTAQDDEPEPEPEPEQEPESRTIGTEEDEDDVLMKDATE